MQTPGPETLELDAHGREGIVLDVALPVMAAWASSVRVSGFRPSMGVSGLSPREVARLRTLALATGARATGLFEGANDFRMGFPFGSSETSAPAALGVEADLTGHSLAPVVSDLVVAAFGLPAGASMTHLLQGFTHQRGASAQGYGGRTLGALARDLGLDLGVDIQELGFPPQGLGRIAISAARGEALSRGPVDWRDRGELRGVRVLLGGVRPRLDQFDRLEAALRETWWEARRIEPSLARLVTPGADFGAFLQLDVEFERGGATFLDVVSRSTTPVTLARKAVKRAQAYLDSPATCDEVTGILALSAAVAGRAQFEVALAPSRQLSAVCSLLRDLGAYIEEEEAPGLVFLKTGTPQGPL